MANTYSEIMADIRAGKFSPVYILMGPEAYYIDKIVEGLEAKVVPEEEKEFNYYQHFGAESNAESVAMSARRFPMMAERQLVILKEAQSMFNAKKELDKLAPYLKHPSNTTVLAIAYKGDMLPATSEFIKQAGASKDVVLFKSQALREWNIMGPIKDIAREYGLGIDDAAASMLADALGTDLSAINSQIRKLSLTLPPAAKRINVEIVRENVAGAREFSAFELSEAIVNRNYDKAMKVVTEMTKNSAQKNTFMLAGTLLSQFTKVVLAHLSDDKSEAALRELCDAKSMPAMRSLKTGMRNYPLGSAVRAIGAIRRFDTHSKGIESSQGIAGLLVQLVFEIFTGV